MQHRRKKIDENFSSSSENTKNHVFRGAAGAAKLKMGYEKMGGPKFWRVGGGWFALAFLTKIISLLLEVIL